MSEYYFLVSLGYLLLTIAVGAYEAQRIRVTGPDSISVFIVLFAVQCCLPGIVIYACLPLVDGPEERPHLELVEAAGIGTVGKHRARRCQLAVRSRSWK